MDAATLTQLVDSSSQLGAEVVKHREDLMIDVASVDSHDIDARQQIDQSLLCTVTVEQSTATG